MDVTPKNVDNRIISNFKDAGKAWHRLCITVKWQTALILLCLKILVMPDKRKADKTKPDEIKIGNISAEVPPVSPGALDPPVTREFDQPKKPDEMPPLPGEDQNT